MTAALDGNVYNIIKHEKKHHQLLKMSQISK